MLRVRGVAVPDFIEYALQSMSAAEIDAMALWLVQQGLTIGNKP